MIRIGRNDAKIRKMFNEISVWETHGKTQVSESLF